MSESIWSSSTTTTIREQRDRRRRRRGLSFFRSWDRRRAQSSSPRMDVGPQTQQTLLVKSLLSQPTSIHLSFSSNSCCLTRDALPMQSDRSSWILITVSSTRFHHLGVPLPWSYPHLSVVFLKDAGTHAHKNLDCLSLHTL